MKLAERKIYKLHQKQAHGKFKDKMLQICWNHSLIVREISLQIAKNLEKRYKIKINKKLLAIGALIHDIGFYDCFDDNYKKSKKYILHGKIGYDILKNEKYSENIARFALTHIGVGVGEDVPISLEEEIVSYADNFHSKGHPRFDTYEEIVKEYKKYPGDEIILERFRKKFGIPELKSLKAKYKCWHEEINEWIKKVKPKE